MNEEHLAKSTIRIVIKMIVPKKAFIKDQGTTHHTTSLDWYVARGWRDRNQWVTSLTNIKVWKHLKDEGKDKGNSLTNILKTINYKKSYKPRPDFIRSGLREAVNTWTKVILKPNH